MPGEYHNINAGAPPFGNRSIVTDPPGGLDDPYGGNDPHPIVTGPDTQYIPFGAFGTMDRGINSPRVPAVERDGRAAARQELGRLGQLSGELLGPAVGADSAQPRRLHGLGPCTINGVSYTVCTTNANLNQRRKLFQINPVEAGRIGAHRPQLGRRFPEVQRPENSRHSVVAPASASTAATPCHDARVRRPPPRSTRRAAAI